MYTTQKVLVESLLNMIELVSINMILGCEMSMKCCFMNRVVLVSTLNRVVLVSTLVSSLSFQSHFI